MSGLVNVIEGVEKLLLSCLLSGDELYIIDEEEVDVAVFHAEFLARAVLYGFEQLVCELVALYVGDLRCGWRALPFRSISPGESAQPELDCCSWLCRLAPSL